MLNYKHNLKPLARSLRKKQSRAELILWGHLRKKQVLGILFGRQKPIGPLNILAHKTPSPSTALPPLKRGLGFLRNERFVHKAMLRAPAYIYSA